MRNRRFELLYKIKCTAACDIPAKKSDTFLLIHVRILTMQYSAKLIIYICHIFQSQYSQCICIAYRM